MKSYKNSTLEKFEYSVKRRNLHKDALVKIKEAKQYEGIFLWQ